MPANLRARPVSHESCLAAICSPNQKSGHRVYSVLQTLSPLENPVDRDCDAVWESRFYPSMNIDEVDRTRTRCSQYAEIVPLDSISASVETKSFYDFSFAAKASRFKVMLGFVRTCANNSSVYFSHRLSGFCCCQMLRRNNEVKTSCCLLAAKPL